MTHHKPSVVLVGGPDVDARLELMHSLEKDFAVSALGSDPALERKFLAQGFAYQSYHLSRQANPFSDLVTMFHLAVQFLKFKPRIVHTFDTKPGVWGCLAARMMGVPIIISTFTGFGSLYGNQNLKTRILRMIYQTLQKLAGMVSDVTICQNHDDARQLVTSGMIAEKKIKVILGSGVTTNFYDASQVPVSIQIQLRNAFGIHPDDIIVTMISRVIRSKGVPDFVTSAREIGVCHKNVRFLLVGSEDTGSLDRLNDAERAQLVESVIWHGPSQDVRSVLAITHIFVLPSAYREGIPRVLLEAASMGLPIVTTDSPGCREVVEDGINGFLVPLHDAGALRCAILRLINQPELGRIFGAASRRRAVERFELAIIAEQIRSVYYHFLAKRHLVV